MSVELWCVCVVYVCVVMITLLKAYEAALGSWAAGRGVEGEGEKEREFI